jgi:hypothetical protein
MQLIERLLAEDPFASEVLRRQIVVVMPICNPDGYVKPEFKNDFGLDAYLEWNEKGPTQPDKMPEAMAIQKILDRYQPEVVSDVHGNDMSFPGYIHFEGHVNNPSLRSYEPEVERLMDEAALEAGYPTYRGEADEQRIFTGPVKGIPSDKQSRKKPRIFCGTYAYLQYHSLMLASENAWPESFVARHERLLRIGNEVWPGEREAGYPTRTILTHGHQIVAAGRNASERRRSRVELWNKQHLLTLGFSNPQYQGFVMAVCATTPSAAKKYFGDGSLAGFQTAITALPKLDSSSILRQLSDHPQGSGQWGPAPKIDSTGNRGRIESDETLKHGFGLRIRIPYAKSRLTHLQLNNRVFESDKSHADCTTWSARGYRYVQFDLAQTPENRDELFIAICRYELK